MRLGMNSPMKTSSRVSSKKTNPFWDLYRDGITRSALETFNRCPEEFRLRYVEGLENIRSSYAANFGNVFHDTCDNLYSAWEREGRKGKTPFAKWAKSYLSGYLAVKYEYARKKLQQAVLPEISAFEELELAYGLTEATLNVYVERWESDFLEKEWIALEEKFDIPYPCPVNKGKTIRLRGKRDGDFRIRKGMWLFETKTKGRIDEGFLMAKLSLDLQTNLYMLTQRMTYGKTPKGVLYNIVRRTQLKKGKDSVKSFCERVENDIRERPEFYFIRMEGATTPQELNEWEEGSFRGMLTRLVLWYQKVFHLRDDSACERPWGSCDNLSICSTGEVSKYFRRRQHVFPELEEGT